MPSIQPSTSRRVGDMQKTIRQRRTQVPSVGGTFGWVGRGDHLDSTRQHQVADAALEGHAKHGRLYSRRRRGQLVQEQVAGAGLVRAAWPRMVAPGAPLRR